MCQTACSLNPRIYSEKREPKYLLEQGTFLFVKAKEWRSLANRLELGRVAFDYEMTSVRSSGIQVAS